MLLFPVVVVQSGKPMQNMTLITSSALFIHQIKLFVCHFLKKKKKEKMGEISQQTSTRLFDIYYIK